MCSEGGTDSSVSNEVSDSATESTTENNDSATELYEDVDDVDDVDTNESSDNLVDETDSETESELVENEPEKMETSENRDSYETETNDDTDSTDSEMDAEVVREEIKEKSDYSDEVNEKISSVEELEVYQKANLKEENIDGRTCLVRYNIDMEYVDPKSGMTNQELMEKGRAPYDAKTDERIELHHIGQDYDSPLAELTEDTEHGDYYSALHTKEGESWRNDSQKNNHYNNVERPGHWKSRVKGG